MAHAFLLSHLSKTPKESTRVCMCTVRHLCRHMRCPRCLRVQRPIPQVPSHLLSPPPQHLGSRGHFQNHPDHHHLGLHRPTQLLFLMKWKSPELKKQPRKYREKITQLKKQQTIRWYFVCTLINKVSLEIGMQS